MKIVFMSGGARAAALRYLIERGEVICGVITPIISDKNNRFNEVIEVANKFNIPIYSVKRNHVVATLDQIQPDIMISCGFPYILENAAIKMVQYAINVHPTLLPKYRGYRSGPYILINGEKKTGVTVHFLTEQMDRGDIIVQREIELSLFDTPKSVYRKIQQVEPQLLFDAIQLVKSGDLDLKQQDETKATEYNCLRTPNDSEIDPHRSIIDLYNEIRACDPDDYPAFFYIDGQKVCIRLWRPNKPDNEQDMI